MTRNREVEPSEVWMHTAVPTRYSPYHTDRGRVHLLGLCSGQLSHFHVARFRL